MEMNDLLKEAIESAKKIKAEEEAKAAAAPVAPETRKLYLIRNVAINSVLFVWQKAKTIVMLRYMQARILYYSRRSRIKQWIFRHKNNIQMYISGYRTISAEQFLTEFPPKKGHKACRAGQGWMVVQLPNKMKVIRWCECVTDKYHKSGKKYKVKQPGEK